MMQRPQMPSRLFVLMPVAFSARLARICNAPRVGGRKARGLPFVGQGCARNESPTDGFESPFCNVERDLGMGFPKIAFRLPATTLIIATLACGPAAFAGGGGRGTSGVAGVAGPNRTNGATRIFIVPIRQAPASTSTVGSGTSSSRIDSRINSRIDSRY
jgi:hypothetical protein